MPNKLKFKHVGRRKSSTECFEKFLENLQMKMTFEAYMSKIVRIVLINIPKRSKLSFDLTFLAFNFEDY